MNNDNLQNIDPHIASIITLENLRTEQTLNLIASENYTWPAVLEANGSILTNKYAEGYPDKRYYGGCQYVDEIEIIAKERCKKLFGAEHVNVQPHSGSQANMAAYAALLQPGDTILGMDLNSGGHLTHGYPLNFSGKWYKSITYSVDPITELINYDEVEQLAHKHKPHLIIAGASAYSRIIDFEKFSKIAQSINAYFMVDIAHIAGLIATGMHPSPINYADVITGTTHKTLRGPRGGFILCRNELATLIDKAIMPGIQGGPLMHTIAAKAVGFKYALQHPFKTYQSQVITNAYTMAQLFINRGYRIVSGGTDNHLFILDLRFKKITGHQAEKILASVGIFVNRNCIPFDQEKPLITSGIRIGTPAITTRGCVESNMYFIVDAIDKALTNYTNQEILQNIKYDVESFCLKYPVYESLSNKEMIPHQQDKIHNFYI